MFSSGYCTVAADKMQNSAGGAAGQLELNLCVMLAGILRSQMILVS